MTEITMSDYETDIVAWSEAQADALRRRSLNEIDWNNVIEEIEAVGRSEISAVLSALRLAMRHKLLIAHWPDHLAQRHWNGERRTHLAAVADEYRPSMRRGILDGKKDKN